MEVIGTPKPIRPNFQVVSEDLIFDVPFQGKTAPSDGMLILLKDPDPGQTHKDKELLLRRTSKCKRAECPVDNIVWKDKKKKIPLLRNGKVVPDGWWLHSTNRGNDRVKMPHELIDEDFFKIRKELGKSGQIGINDKTANMLIELLIKKRFTKNLPKRSKTKLHNVLFHCLNTGEQLRTYHVILSPPQDMGWKTKLEQSQVRKEGDKIYRRSGGWGGMWVPHHARLEGDFNDPESEQFTGFIRDCNEEGYHFHIVGYGFFKYGEWKESGWILKNRGIVKNVWGTVKYVLEHASVISSRTTSLSCVSADPKLFTQSNTNTATIPIDISTNDDIEVDPSNTTNETAGFKDIANSRISNLRQKRKVNHRPFKIYWFTGCLHESKFKVPDPVLRCPLTDHVVKFDKTSPKEVWKREMIKPTEEQINEMQRRAFIEMTLFNETEAESWYQKILEAQSGLKVWIETRIPPEELGKHLKWVKSKLDERIDVLREKDPEKAEIEEHYDPQRRWYVILKEDREEGIFTVQRWKGQKYIDSNYDWVIDSNQDSHIAKYEGFEDI